MPRIFRRINLLSIRSGFKRLPRCGSQSPSADEASEVARIVSGLGIVALANGSEHLLEVTFDAGTQGRAKDFRPSLPLVFDGNVPPLRFICVFVSWWY